MPKQINSKNLEVSLGLVNQFFVIHPNANSANAKDIVENLLNLGDVKTDIESYYLKKYKFTVEDKKVKKQIKKISSKYID